MFRDLTSRGRLLSTVERMQNQANERMLNLKECGLHHDQAWEIVKDDVLLPSEEDVPNLGESLQLYTD